jgi:hypothetical protein
MINVSNWLTSDLEAVFDHQSLPYKMAVWHKDEAQKALSNIPLALVSAAPLYTADRIC